MSPEPTPSLDRLYDLLAEEALEGLTPAERDELRRLLARFPDVEPTQLERAAAALQLGLHRQPPEPLPAGLRDRLAPAPAAARRAEPAADRRPALHRPSMWYTAFAWTGWAVAAACLVWAVTPALLDQFNNTPEARLHQMERSGATTVTWQPSQGALSRPVDGTVVWDRARQSGYLRIEGLPANDPNREQYQLWLIDGRRDEHPIDGGVFDVPPSGVAVVPFRPSIGPVDPTKFAITRERPGGVVVTKQRFLVTAGIDR
jgi:hypothetical protein